MLARLASADCLSGDCTFCYGYAPLSLFLPAPFVCYNLFFNVGWKSDRKCSLLLQVDWCSTSLLDVVIPGFHQTSDLECQDAEWGMWIISLKVWSAQELCMRSCSGWVEVTCFLQLSPRFLRYSIVVCLSKWVLFDGLFLALLFLCLGSAVALWISMCSFRIAACKWSLWSSLKFSNALREPLQVQQQPPVLITFLAWSMAEVRFYDIPTVYCSLLPYLTCACIWY